MAQVRQIRVLLVDDHALFRAGLASILSSQPDIEVVGEAEDGLDALVKAQELQPDLILMDVTMPGSDGLEATRLIKQALPDVKIVMLTVHDEDNKLLEAIRSGAAGYLLKSTTSKTLIPMLRGAIRGEAAISGVMAAQVLEDLGRLARRTPTLAQEVTPVLTQRQEEVLGLVAAGATHKEVAAELTISPDSVEAQLRDILSTLHAVALENAVLENELQLACRLQVSLLPAKVPEISGWEFAARWLPAREVAGDYYDFIPRPGGQLGLVIADVTDKGLPAALFMALSRSVLRASLQGEPSPVKGITRANEVISAESTEGFFVTLVYALLDEATNQVTYVNAGHNPPLLYRRDQGQIENLPRTGMPLGIDGDVAFQQRKLTLNSGDFILFYTDGVTEAINSQLKEFGRQRLRRVILDHRDSSSDGIVAAVEQAVKDFTGSAPLFDDTTILVAKRVRVVS